MFASLVVYRNVVPTSNHNHSLHLHFDILVVSYVFPTSNHNSLWMSLYIFRLYLMFFLHQTTTMACPSHGQSRCILCFSYIKPQPFNSYTNLSESCILCFSYIKPQLTEKVVYLVICCILCFSYIKPQLQRT